MQLKKPTVIEIAFQKAMKKETTTPEMSKKSFYRSKKDILISKINNRKKIIGKTTLSANIIIKKQCKNIENTMFEVGASYENEKGPFEVILIDLINDSMVIRWATGEEIQTEISFQEKIQKRKQFEKKAKNITYESICWDCYKKSGRFVSVYKGFHSVCPNCGWVQCPKCGACKSPEYGGCEERAYFASKVT